MSFDLEKLQTVAELGEVIRLQNEALEKLQAFRKSRPYIMMPNLAKMVEENLKENVMILYKELNNLHKPAEKQTRYICNECKMAFLVPLPGGICDECRSRKSGGGPREYIPYKGNDNDDEEVATPGDEKTAPAESAAVEASQSAEKSGQAEKAADAPAGSGSGKFNIEDAYAASFAGEATEDVAAETSAEDDDEHTLTIDLDVDEEEMADSENDAKMAKSTSKAADIDQAEPDDNYDNPGDKIELANPATEVAKPENVEGLPDIDDDHGAADERRT